MAMVDLAATAAAERVERHGVTVAVHASPTTCVIAGEEDAVRAACAALEAEGIGVRTIKVDVASHCRLVEPLKEPLVRELTSLRGRRGSVPLLSSVTARPLSGEEIDAAYLWRNLREPVRFAETVEEALASGVRWFVEIGPHPVLTASIAQCLSSGAVENGVVLPTLLRDRDGLQSLLETAAGLYERGRDLNWAAIRAEGPRGKVVDLPQPSLPRRRHWTEPPPARSWRGSARKLSHPLLGEEVESAALDGKRVFELALSAAGLPELAQHRVVDVPILSAGAFLELANAAIRQTVSPDEGVVLEDVTFERLLQVPATSSRAVQVVVSHGRFTIESKASDPGWTRHVSGAYRTTEEHEGFSVPPISSRARSIATAELYAGLEGHGLTYGASCRRVAEVRFDGDVCEARIEAQRDLGDDRYFLHPHLLDMSLQALSPFVSRPALLQSVRRFRGIRRPEGAVFARASGDGGDAFRVVLSDARGVVAIASGLELTSTQARTLREPDVWRKRVEWSRVDAPDATAPSGRWAVIAPSPLKDALEKSAPKAPELDPLAGMLMVASRETEVSELVRLAQSAGPGVPLWLVTRGAFGVLPDDVRNPAHAALQAAARAGWAEGVLDGATLDLDASSSASAEEEAELLWREIGAGGRHAIIARRHGQRYVPRLERARPGATGATGATLPVDGQSTYLVTGGSSDLGLHAAEWLVRRGARHLVLCGRSESMDSRSERLKALEALGVDVRYRSVDVSDSAAVAALAADLESSPIVAGIVHAAGFAELSPFSELTEERIASAFRPKVKGAENLKAHFARPSLKFFLLYASSSTWLGALGRGLAHYAAANAYLEAFAAELARAGTNAIAIAWPPWQGIGRVREAAAAGHFDSLGVKTLLPEEADEILNHLDRQATLLCALDRGRYLCRGADAGLLVDLDDGASSSSPERAPYEAPRDLLEERLASSWQEVLGVERVGRSDSFFSMGGSSIKAATLLNRLRRHMTEPAEPISIVALFEAPTVAHLAAYLREHHPDCARAIESSGPADKTDPVIEKTRRPLELLERIDELSDEEVEALLVEHGHADAR
jgi:myxalamid-type polyketide synthase MxaE and MxaD